MKLTAILKELQCFILYIFGVGLGLDLSIFYIVATALFDLCLLLCVPVLVCSYTFSV